MSPVTCAFDHIVWPTSAVVSVIDQIKDFYIHSPNLMLSDAQTPAQPHMLSLFCRADVTVVTAVIDPS